MAQTRHMPLANSAGRGAADWRSRRVLVHAWLLITAAATLGPPAPAWAQNSSPVPGDHANIKQSPVVRERPVDIDTERLRAMGEAGANELVLRLFDDTAFRLRFERTHPQMPGRAGQAITWSGTLPEDEGGWFVLTLVGDVITANLWTGDGRAFQVRTGRNGEHVAVAQELDPSRFGPCAGAMAPPLPAGGIAGGAAGGTCAPDDGSVIDVLVVYTPAARSTAGAAGIDGIILNSIVTTNVAYENSEVDTRLKLVFSAEVPYEESDMQTDLQRLTQPADGYMDQVHVWRDLYGADLVALLNVSDPGVCGIAWILQANSPASEAMGFSVIGYDCAVGNLSFAHELGHNQGCCHAPGDGGGCTNGGIFAYSWGHRFFGNSGIQFRTVMAYQPGTRIDFFSNPDIFFDGQPTGTPGRDNARTIDETACAVANFRPSTCSPPWFQQFGSDSEDLGNDVKVDGAGNVYVAGNTYGTYPGQQSAGGMDAFYAKYSPAGAQVWVRQFGSSANDNGQGIAVDDDGNVYVTGITLGTLPGQQSAGGTDSFLAKYSVTGAQLWVRQFGTGDLDWANDADVDGAGNVYVTGYSYGTFPGQQDIDGADSFLAKYSPGGNLLWVMQFGTSLFDWCHGVAVEDDGDAYVAGWGSGTLPGQQSAGSQDAFLFKYNSGGTQLWARQLGTSTGDSGWGVAVDGAGNAYVAGTTGGTLPGQQSAGGGDAFIAKYSSGGSQLWIRQFGTSEFDRGFDIALNNAGDASITGYTDGQFPGQQSAGDKDAYLVTYSSGGTQIEVRQFGTTNDDEGLGVAVDIAGNAYVAGWTCCSGEGYRAFLARQPACAAGIPGDLNGDGSVGIIDFLALLVAWGPCPAPCPPECAADLDGNCSVGIVDLLLLLIGWTP